jgi:biotin carboxyl carrier protein
MAVKGLWVLVFVVCLAGCSGADPAATTDAGLDSIDVTQWTDKTELFAEYPPLVAGQTSRFAIHLTDLRNFKAVTAGEVQVRLEGGDGQKETFRVRGHSRPGIFGVDVKQGRSGARMLVIALTSPGLTDEHQWRREVHADHARRARPSKRRLRNPGISFLKEQQWRSISGISLADERPIRVSLRVPASIVARPGGAAQVVAPIAGRLIQVAPVGPGAGVSQGQELARLLPPPSVPGELPQLEQASASAAAEAELAMRDRERAERLVTAGASPQKRLDEARAVEARALARQRAADAQIAQYNAARTGTGGGNASGLFILRSPIGGVIASRQATNGANVTAGSMLFEIADVSQVQITGRIPEAQAPQAARTTAAEIDIAGREAIPMRGRAAMLERCSIRKRTLPIVFADNRVLRLPLGQAVFLRLDGRDGAASGDSAAVGRRRRRTSDSVHPDRR